MSAHKSIVREQVIRMYSEGLTIREMAAAIGCAESTAKKYVWELKRDPEKRTEKKICLNSAPPGFRRDWMIAVNRIRRYCGLEVLQEEYEEVEE